MLWPAPASAILSAVSQALCTVCRLWGYEHLQAVQSFWSAQVVKHISCLTTRAVRFFPLALTCLSALCDGQTHHEGQTNLLPSPSTPSQTCMGLIGVARASPVTLLKADILHSLLQLADAAHHRGHHLAGSALSLVELGSPRNKLLHVLAPVQLRSCSQRVQLI